MLASSLKLVATAPSSILPHEGGEGFGHRANHCHWARPYRKEGGRILEAPSPLVGEDKGAGSPRCRLFENVSLRLDKPRRVEVKEAT
jgi:hypothetical protein